MSWSIYVKGSKSEVLEKVKAATCTGDDTQFVPARALIVAEVEAMPEGAHVSVEANGHHYQSAAGDWARNLLVRVERAAG